MGRILSGIQPTGGLHLGNYLGAIKNWVSMQHDHECLFCMVDLHALTTQPDPQKLKEDTWRTAALYIAAGVDPEKSIIFPQSAIPEHSELMWLLSCFTPLGWLNRMTQFKEKAGKSKDTAVLGLYSYPVLMAADILLYQATDVPVGEDQKQHLELARDIAGAVNHRYEKPLFTLPTPRIQGHGTRVMSLKDGTKKMSKSDPAEGSRLGLFDSPDVLVQKIKKSRTDSGVFPTNKEEMVGRPEVENLITIYAALTDKSLEHIYATFGGHNFAPFKQDLADIAVSTLNPIRTKYISLMNDRSYLETIIQNGIVHAKHMARNTMTDIKSAMGLF